MMKVLYATTNPGKLAEVKKLFGHHGIAIVGPEDLGLKLDVDETGNTLEENAKIKANAYIPHVPADVIVVADDTGLEIDALDGEPGVKVRRWKGYTMTDSEIREYCLDRLRGVPKGKRQAHFRTVIAVAVKGEPIRIFEGKLDGEILIDPKDQEIEGYPFEPLFYVGEWGRVIGDIYKLSPKEREKFMTHRHLAVHAAVPYLRQLIGQS